MEFVKPNGEKSITLQTPCSTLPDLEVPSFTMLMPMQSKLLMLALQRMSLIKMEILQLPSIIVMAENPASSTSAYLDAQSISNVMNLPFETS
jgi:hypothetical protein